MKKDLKAQTLKKKIIQSSIFLVIVLFSIAYFFIVALNVDYVISQNKENYKAYKNWCTQEIESSLSVADKAISMLRVDENLLEMFQRNVYGIHYSDHYEKITDTISLRDKTQNICSALEIESIVFFIPYDDSCPTGLIDEYVYNDELLAKVIGEKSDVMSLECNQMHFNYGLTDSAFWEGITGRVLHDKRSKCYTSFYALTNFSKTEYYGCVAISINCEVVTKGIEALYENSDEYKLSIKDLNSNAVLYSNGVLDDGQIFSIEEYGLEVKQFLKTDIFFNAFLTCVIILVVMSVGCAIFISVLSRVYKKVFGDIHDYIDSMQTQTKSTDIAVPQYEEFIAISENFNSLIEKLNGVIREKSDYEVAQKDAQLLSLQYQINPHFLFNMIEVFRMRLEASGDGEASESMKDFGQFLRYNLSGESAVDLDEEVKMAERFIGLFRFKYADRLTHEIRLPNELKGIKTIKFILQPIVENSIKYGFQGKNRVHITIDCCEDGDLVVLSVKDNGAGITEERLFDIRNSLGCDENSKYSIGLSNVYRRLKLFYGEKGSFSIDSKAGEGTCVKIAFAKDYKHEDSFN